MKKRNKRAVIALAVVAVFLIALEVFLGVWFFGKKYPTFDENARAEAALAGLEEGFVPQGLSECAGGYLVSGYMKDGSTSRIYFLGEETKYITVEQNGKNLNSHFGGISATEAYIYLTNGKKIARIPLADALAAENGGAVSVYDEFDAGFSLAFCQIWNGSLFVGEFYRAGNYETDESHYVTVGEETNRALVYCYELNEDAERFVSGTPYAVLSVRGLVQGIAFTEENIYLSCSWGLADSEVCVYENRLKNGAEKAADYEIEGASVPVYFLGSGQEIARMSLPCMTEGIYAKEGRLYVLFESACKKYRYFVRRKTDEVISLPLEIFG